MKRFSATLLAAVAAFSVLVGCNQSGTPGGSSGTDNKKPIIGDAEKTFHLSVPTLSTKIKQGETKAFEIGVKRGKNFGEDVALKFENLPKGVMIEPAEAMVKHGDETAKLTVKAAEDAAIGEFKVKVNGQPTKGEAAHNEFTIHVEKK